MARTLGGVTLPDSLEWIDRYEDAGVLQAVDVTLDGTPLIHAAARPLGRAITLEARDRVTWLTTATITAVQALAAVAGASYALDWDGEPHTVVFDIQRGALRFSEVMPAAGQWLGTIRLITV